MTNYYLALRSDLDNYVQKETGKGLSTNDFTNDLKTKLDGIAAGAEVNVIATVKKNGTALTVTDKVVNVEVPVALSELTDDSTHRLVTDTEKATWNAKQDALTFDDAPTSGSANPVKSGGVYTALDGKVDKVSGKQLSTEDFTTALKTKLDGIATGAQVNVLEGVLDVDGEPLTIDANKKVTLSKAAVGLANVNNTSDADKPISTATQTALDGKVDKVTGKGLSTNDYTTAEKEKLAAIAAGAQVNVIEVVKRNGTALTITDKAVDISVPTTLGDIADTATYVRMLATERTKLTGIEEGAEVNVNANWSETDSTKDAYIQNKPFQTIGTGLTVTDGVLSANVQLHYEIFETLPTPSATYAQTIALVLKTTTETGNVYKEYICVNKGTTASPDWAWEQIGETAFELTITQNASGITINGTALQSATNGQKGLLTAADWTTFNAKQDALTFDNVPTADSNNPVKSSGILTALNGKVTLANGSGDKTGVKFGVDSTGRPYISYD